MTMVRSVANKRPYLFTVAGGALRPFDNDTEQRLGRFADGAVVRCQNVTQPRTIPFQGYYWATLANIVEATGCAPTSDHLHDHLVKICGYTALITDIDGKPVDLVRDSTAFESMDEPTFSAYVNHAQQMLAERLGIVWDDFTLKRTT